MGHFQDVLVEISTKPLHKSISDAEELLLCQEEMRKILLSMFFEMEKCSVMFDSL